MWSKVVLIRECALAILPNLWYYGWGWDYMMSLGTLWRFGKRGWYVRLLFDGFCAFFYKFSPTFYTLNRLHKCSLHLHKIRTQSKVCKFERLSVTKLEDQKLQDDECGCRRSLQICRRAEKCANDIICLGGRPLIKHLAVRDHLNAHTAILLA